MVFEIDDDFQNDLKTIIILKKEFKKLQLPSKIHPNFMRRHLRDRFRLQIGLWDFGSGTESTSQPILTHPYRKGNTSISS